MEEERIVAAGSVQTEEPARDEDFVRRHFSWLGNGFVILLTLALLGMSLLMMWMDYKENTPLAPNYTVYQLRFSLFYVLYGLAIIIILCRTADKRREGLAAFAGILLVAIPVACKIMGIGYTLGGVYSTSVEGLGILGMEMVSLGYFLLAGWAMTKVEGPWVRFVVLWLLTLGAMAYLWEEKSFAVMVFLCGLAFVALWSDARGFSLMVLVLMGAALLALLLYALRAYDIYQLSGKNIEDFDQGLLRVAGWILPSARAKTQYGPAMDALWKGAGMMGRAGSQLREILPNVRFSDMSFSLLYVTSWFGKAAFASVMVVYLLLLWQIYVRCSYALSVGDPLRGCISFGVFVKLSFLALIHIGYCFGWLPIFHSYMPLFCFGGGYWLVEMAQIGLVLRIGGDVSVGLRE